ncbi:hypothetical protein A4D02_24950 [Niastella koreensis]|uniref:Polymer-forming cytoskeletal protein n=2 Tax=Niastella koreensis TaxID=354356 RepID=G8TFY0_NIAKG|nr:hypothetical protein [Niastella koreensis]AEW00579.1 hypothetical protein Niako_4316 [Niastella koreensis GR20-10]OQP52438.1 hypothetical protein A4D02_24950 [Niastella koreensis]
MKQVLLLWLLVVTMGPVGAQMGKNVVIDKPVYEDVYITGGEVMLNAPVYGDLVVAGGTVTINDTVSNDILAGGGTITFNGYVGDDIRCAGGQLNILKNVAGDVVVTGGKVLIGKEAVIGGLLSAGSEITIDGQVNGKFKTRSGKLYFDGHAMNDVDCRGGDIIINGIVGGRSVLAGDKLTIGNAASFDKDVHFWTSSGNVDFHNSVKNGQAVYDPSLKMRKDQWYFLGFSSLLGLIWYVGMVLVMIMIIQYLFSSTMKKAGQTAYDKTVRSLGFGFLFWIGVPVAAAIACITVIGVPAGLVLLFSYIILAVFAGTITSVVAANWLNNRSYSKWRYWRLVFAALAIFVVLRIVSLTPFLGWFIFALIVCTAFGSIILNVNWKKEN